jgi:hypothetical protein
MLGTKCGWLVKRNEQRVWQKRWCCVVPHTFLYYFEAGPQMEVKSDENDSDGSNNIHTYEAWSGGGININAFANLDQEALNLAVKDGYDDVGHGSGSRRSLYSLPNIMGAGGGGANGVGRDNNGDNDESLVAWDPEHSALTSHLSPVGGGEGGDGNIKGTYQFVASSNLQPVGIIDLECYSSVNRSNINPTVLELAGDSVVNPDLRSFYFQSATVEDAESWIKALLSDRHHSLKDETEAYRQVCESFPLQLANCSEMIDAAETKADAMEREAYAVRSASEESRRRVVNAVREMLERRCWEAVSTNRGKKVKMGKNDKISGNMSPFGYSGLPVELDMEVASGNTNEQKSLLNSVLDEHFEKLETNRVAFLRELEASLSSPSAVATSNVIPPVQTLVDYTSTIIGSFGDLRTHLQKYEKDLSTTVQQDQSQLEALKGTIEERNAQLADVERKLSMVASDFKSELDDSRQQVEELTKQLEAQRIEFSIYQNSTKTKLSELQQHKKILKREVIDLRKKIDECSSENTTIAHEFEKMKSHHQTIKDRNTTLERYIDRLEKQVGVQQNMMEMMSQSGGASFVGKIVGPGVAQSDARDAISLSGVSIGSQSRRLNSSSSNAGDLKSTNYSQMKPRTLLPPESKSKHVHDVSPLPTPQPLEKSVKGTNRCDRGPTDVAQREDDRDTSTACYRSDSTAEEGDSVNNHGSGGIQPHSSPTSPQQSPNKSSSENTVIGIISCDTSDPILSKRSVEFVLPNCTSDEKTETRSIHAAAMAAAGVSSDCAISTPTQSNAGKEQEVVQYLSEVKPQPSMDSSAEQLLKTSSSIEDVKVQVASLNNQLLSGGTNVPGTGSVGHAGLEDDDLDDSVSRVSDITEDRTQRQIDDDLAERRKILLAYVNKTNGGSSNNSLSNVSTQRRLETIENMLPSTALSTSDSQSGLASRGRLSVAQRARLDAENRANSHRSPSPASRRSGGDSLSQSGYNAPLGARGDSSVRSASSVATPTSRSDTIGRSGSFLKSLGKAIEKAVDSSVLGVSLPADDYDESSYDGTESEVVSSIVSDATVSVQGVLVI